MEGVGRKLRSRALELGLSDAEVARRTGLTATRYGHYVSDYREPDLATLVRICRVLGLRPDELLGYEKLGADGDELAIRRRRLEGFVHALDAETLDLALSVVQALAATSALRSSETEASGIQSRETTQKRPSHRAKASRGKGSDDA